VQTCRLSKHIALRTARVAVLCCSCLPRRFARSRFFNSSYNSGSSFRRSLYLSQVAVLAVRRADFTFSGCRSEQLLCAGAGWIQVAVVWVHIASPVIDVITFLRRSNLAFETRGTPLCANRLRNRRRAGGNDGCTARQRAARQLLFLFCASLKFAAGCSALQRNSRAPL